VSDAELHAHAQQRIGERPAWPKHFHIVEAIPTTSVGKIFKPEPHCDVAARMVRPSGMRVSVSLSESSRSVVPAIKQTLDAYLFESQVLVV
jgi:fatty-acyl-CoA synthase